LEKAFFSLEEQLKIMPDYSPALLLTAVIFCLEGKNEKAQELLQGLKQKKFDATSTLNKIAGRLYTNKKNYDALLILNAMIENMIANQETMRLVDVLQNSKSAA
jgi:hypothetical protein